jgi:hypothetical protein
MILPPHPVIGRQLKNPVYIVDDVSAHSDVTGDNLRDSRYALFYRLLA